MGMIMFFIAIGFMCYSHHWTLSLVRKYATHMEQSEITEMAKRMWYARWVSVGACVVILLEIFFNLSSS